MTDNAFAYVHNRSLRELLADKAIKHLRTEPYRPRTNGKAERFHQTMAREWGYGMAYRSYRHRNQALPHWLDHYNERRPHSSLGGRPPISGGVAFSVWDRPERMRVIGVVSDAIDAAGVDRGDVVPAGGPDP
jgi:Integrase core domain